MPVASIVPDSTAADFGQRPVGTGAWRLVEWKHDDYLRFARNPGYWGGAPAAESLMARVMIAREEGQALVEYSLILALVSIAAIVTLGLVGGGIVTELEKVVTAL